MDITKSERKIILVIEDDIGIRDTIVQILSYEGYSVIGKGNGLEALEYLRGALVLPSLILLDLMMPIMNGWEFRSTQKNDRRLSVIPVVILSADSTVKNKAVALEVAAYLQKPVELDTLLEAVERYS